MLSHQTNVNGFTLEHINKPAHWVIGSIIKAIEKNVRRQRWLILLRYHSRVDANSATYDPETLHDFRVELRRLRVWLAQSRDCVVTRRAARRQLRILAQASNAPRDQEVLQAQLAKIEPETPHSATANMLFSAEFIAQLQARLPTLATRRRKQKSQPFGLWLAQHLKAALLQSQACLNGDEARLHDARIHIKHLRYLIEPFIGVPPVAAAIAHLKSLQTHLGDLHDLSLMRQQISSWVCAQLNAQLTEIAALPELKKTQIQQVFNPARDAFIRALNWQTSQHKAALSQWYAKAAQQQQTLDTLMHAVINALTTADKA